MLVTHSIDTHPVICNIIICVADDQLGTQRQGPGNAEALPGLLAALPVDNFWMVRCEIIQALERIAHPAAVPVLRSVAQNDSFQVVREYAAKAVQRLA